MWLLSSCLGSNDIGEVEIAKNCQIKSVVMSHDSIEGLDTVKFTIDQLAGRIFNMDSLPYGTEVEKVYCSITMANSVAISGIEVTPSAYADSTYSLSSFSDSIDFSAPVRFVVHAYDGVTTKVYTAQINVHQVIPDSMVWSLYADPMIGLTVKEQRVIPYTYEGTERYFMYVKPADSGSAYQLYQASVDEPADWSQLPLTGLPADGLSLSQLTEFGGALYVASSDGTLYRSADGMNWVAMTDTPSVRTILGRVGESSRQEEVLATIAERDGSLLFYALDGAMTWTAGEEIPADFPVSGFGSLRYTSMYHEYLQVAGGRSADNTLRNGVWSTRDGRSWATMAAHIPFTPREGAMMAIYDNRFFLIGGIDSSGKGQKDMYSSFDHGVTWALVDSMEILPPEFAGRGFSSIYVDEANRVNLFGGRSSSGANDLNQLWRGRIYRLVPKE